MTAGRQAQPRDEAMDERRRRLKETQVGRDPGDIEPLRVAVEAANEAGLSKEEVAPAEQLLRKLEGSQPLLVFADLPREEMERLQAAQSKDRINEILMRCMGLSLDDGFRAEILAEFHYHNLLFCQSSGFCCEKASTFLSLMKAVHTRAVAEGQWPELRARELFEELLERHGKQLPPYCVGIFSREDQIALRRHVNRTFFRHYSMYVFAYRHKLELIVKTTEIRTVLAVPAPEALHRRHEVDPRNVPELQELFADPGGSEVAAAPPPGAAAPLSRSSSELPALGEDEVNVLAAIEEAMKGHAHLLGKLDA